MPDHPQPACRRGYEEAAEALATFAEEFSEDAVKFAAGEAKTARMVEVVIPSTGEVRRMTRSPGVLGRRCLNGQAAANRL